MSCLMTASTTLHHDQRLFALPSCLCWSLVRQNLLAALLLAEHGKISDACQAVQIQHYFLLSAAVRDFLCYV